MPTFKLQIIYQYNNFHYSILRQIIIIILTKFTGLFIIIKKLFIIKLLYNFTIYKWTINCESLNLHTVMKPFT